MAGSNYATASRRKILEYLKKSNDHTVTAADGSNDIRVTGSSNNITAGSGNNKIGISGDDNTLSPTTVR